MSKAAKAKKKPARPAAARKGPKRGVKYRKRMKGPLKISDAKKLLIMKKHMEGKSARKIALELLTGRDTVLKVVKSKDMRAAVERGIGEFFGMITKANKAIARALDKDNSTLAWELLAAVGVVPRTAVTPVQIYDSPPQTDEASRRDFEEKLGSQDKFALAIARTMTDNTVLYDKDPKPLKALLSKDVVDIPEAKNAS